MGRAREDCDDDDDSGDDRRDGHLGQLGSGWHL